MYHHRRDDVHFPCPSFGKLVIGGNPNVLNMAHQSVRTPFARLFIQNNFKVIKLFIFIWISVTLLILIKIDPNLILAQFDTTEDDSTGNNFRIFSV